MYAAFGQSGAQQLSAVKEKGASRPILVFQTTTRLTLLGNIMKNDGKKRLLLRIGQILLLLEILSEWAIAQETVGCVVDEDCEAHHRAGSKCLSSGKCSNPFVAGCLRSHMKNDLDQFEEKLHYLASLRTCNNDDNTTDTKNEQQQHCQPSPLNYDEIRVHNGNWESPVFYSWIIQIFLSEFLQVPTRVGLGKDSNIASFYNPEADLYYSDQAYAFEEFETANRMGGHCELTREPCAHVSPEVWIGQEKRWLQAISEGSIDPSFDDGQVGKISWYIPFRTAKRYPNFATYQGMQGQREELSSLFLRPTTWKEYCDEESTSNCLDPDEFAQRPPATSDEERMYFYADYFTGFFRATEKNDCIQNPSTCTGHIAGPSCDWSTNVEAQTFHHDIPLESDGKEGFNGGYSYEHMIQLWRAANATNSDLIMWWWSPDATKEEFRGTDFQFQRVLLPEPTAKCRAARIDPLDRCSADPVKRRGVKDGACDNEANSLQKLISRSLNDMTNEKPRLERSPGYQAIINLKVTQLSMNSMLRKWVDGGRTGLAAREAVCDWVYEHKEELMDFFPEGYPRTVSEDTSYQRGLHYSAQAVAGIALLYVFANSALVYLWRKTTKFASVQQSFLFLILFGLFLVSVGAIMFALEPADGVCIAQVWLVTLGYTLELVPLLVKVAAINRLMLATRRFRRIRIDPKILMMTVAGVTLAVATYLTVWTIIDPPLRYEDAFLEDNNRIIKTLECKSKSDAWAVVALCVEAVLILAATVIAYQSRQFKTEFNSSTHLGIMIYSHFVFFGFRVVAFNAGKVDLTVLQTITPEIVAAFTSFLLSFDVITAITLYIVPKLMEPKSTQVDRTKKSLAVHEISRLALKESPHLQKERSQGPRFTKEFLQVFGGYNLSSRLKSMTPSEFDTCKSEVLADAFGGDPLSSTIVASTTRRSSVIPGTRRGSMFNSPPIITDPSEFSSDQSASQDHFAPDNTPRAVLGKDAQGLEPSMDDDLFLSMQSLSEHEPREQDLMPFGSSQRRLDLFGLDVDRGAIIEEEDDQDSATSSGVLYT